MHPTKFHLRDFFNFIRNILIFKISYPWVRIGKQVHCQLGSHFWSPRHDIVLGNRVGIGYNCLFQCDIRIGNEVMIASDCAFVNRDDHIYNIVGQTMWESGRGDQFKIIIEDDVWVGHGVIVVAPAHIGRGAILAAGGVVVTDVPNYAIVGGVPAKVIKMRFTEEEISEHERLLQNRSKVVAIWN
jgi:acetyltransferase-like isoleucine patch superfamily enzyme